MAKINRPRDYPFAFIEWLDAHGNATKPMNDMTLAEFHDPLRCIIAGWLRKQDEKGVTICQEWCDGDDYRGSSFIPRDMIKAIDVVYKAKVEAKHDKGEAGEGSTPSPA